MECYVLPIDDIDKVLDHIKDDEPIGFILLSTFKVDMSDEWNPIIKIDFLDVTRKEEGFISEDKIEELYKFIRSYWYLDKWIVACDAGISRSPAVAMAVMNYFGCNEVADGIRSMYKFYNSDIYSEISNKFKELEDMRKSI